MNENFSLFHMWWMNKWCFRPQFCTVRLYWAGENLGLKDVCFLVWIMPQVQGQSLDVLTCSQPLYHDYTFLSTRRAIDPASGGMINTEKSSHCLSQAWYSPTVQNSDRKHHSFMHSFIWVNEYPNQREKNLWGSRWDLVGLLPITLRTAITCCSLELSSQKPC